MSQHTGSHKNSLNLLGEKYLNESHWPMRRIRLLECKGVTVVERFSSITSLLLLIFLFCKKDLLCTFKL